MGLVLVTDPAEEPVSLAEAKSHLRVEVSDDDSYITSLIQVAREMAENILRRALITQTWKLVLDEFPSGDEIELPLPPLQSVSSVKYTPNGSSQQTFDAGNYIVDTASEPGRIVLKSDKSWPGDTLEAAAGVEVTFVCGYGDAGADVPLSIRQAMLLLIGHFYESREAVIIGTITRELPLGAKRLLWPYRVFG